MNVVYVALGSALGGVCRYGLSLVLNSPTGFPWGMLVGYIATSLLAGLAAVWLGLLISRLG